MEEKIRDKEEHRLLEYKETNLETVPSKVCYRESPNIVADKDKAESCNKEDAFKIQESLNVKRSSGNLIEISNEEANQVLEDLTIPDTPENRLKAFCVYAVKEFKDN